MEKKRKRDLIIAISLLASFVAWTLLVCIVDVGAIGPCGSRVGFSTFNASVHELTGVNWTLYAITDWLGLVPIFVALGFAMLGMFQWIKQKSLSGVDRSLFVLGGFYVVVMAVFVFFEQVVVNYRPVLIDGVLEASYPSSTTMLVMCVMPTAVMQCYTRIKRHSMKRCVAIVMLAFTAFMVIGRLLAGVHWISDIIGGALLSAGLVTMYAWIIYQRE